MSVSAERNPELEEAHIKMVMSSNEIHDRYGPDQSVLKVRWIRKGIEDVEPRHAQLVGLVSTELVLEHDGPIAVGYDVVWHIGTDSRSVF
eukprot:CAMPEP_0172360030 /NCGR_PEP_ID=MMETSP1060-20121228/4130_1 /TAXON_ID=37318 /ORGANISM="Pseudo-nitzschia pungens, Strain cf. cingulata" /LENGTH=89 /DNA_ID=CAMNT_0013081891 /DNA_START=271 /DNA_END=540 /DNA_ORIENTATION=-